MPDGGTPDLSETLSAFIHLQLSNAKITHRLTGDLGIGLKDLRALVLISDLTTTTPKDLAAQLHISTGAITNLIDRMEAVDLVARIPHPSDRRSSLLILRPAGVDAIADITDTYSRAFRSALDPEQLAGVGDVFTALGDAFTDASKVMASSV
jgi:DNA-binding MarR family transcriptional regulator